MIRAYDSDEARSSREAATSPSSSSSSAASGGTLRPTRLNEAVSQTMAVDDHEDDIMSRVTFIPSRSRRPPPMETHNGVFGSFNSVSSLNYSHDAVDPSSSTLLWSSGSTTLTPAAAAEATAIPSSNLPISSYGQGPFSGDQGGGNFYAGRRRRLNDEDPAQVNQLNVQRPIDCRLNRLDLIVERVRDETCDDDALSNLSSSNSRDRAELTMIMPNKRPRLPSPAPEEVDHRKGDFAGNYGFGNANGGRELLRNSGVTITAVKIPQGSSSSAVRPDIPFYRGYASDSVSVTPTTTSGHALYQRGGVIQSSEAGNKGFNVLPFCMNQGAAGISMVASSTAAPRSPPSTSPSGHKSMLPVVAAHHQHGQSQFVQQPPAVAVDATRAAGTAANGLLSCEFCRERFEVATKLNLHVSKFHQGVKKYICFVCLKRFKRKQSLEDHISMIHAGKRGAPKLDDHDGGVG